MLGPHTKQVGFSIKREIQACPVAGVSQLHSQTHTDTHSAVQAICFVYLECNGNA